jgi:hypothetical protein
VVEVGGVGDDEGGVGVAASGHADVEGFGGGGVLGDEHGPVDGEALGLVDGDGVGERHVVGDVIGGQGQATPARRSVTAALPSGWRASIFHRSPLRTDAQQYIVDLVHHRTAALAHHGSTTSPTGSTNFERSPSSTLAFGSVT